MRRVLSTYKIKEIIKFFCEDITASKASILLGINRNTINRYYNLFRKKIVSINSNLDPLLSGEIEYDESSFGAKRIRGKRGRGAAGKTPVLGVLKRDGNVYVESVQSFSEDSLMPIIQGKIGEESTICTDGWKAYDRVILNGYDHYRIFPAHNEFAWDKNHVHGIESFWSFAKKRLAKFNGLTDKNFFLYLKKCEFRFNNTNNPNLLPIL